MKIIDYKTSAWNERKAKSFQFFCPQCRTERVLPFHPKPTQLHHFFQVSLTACFITVVTWNVFGWKGIFSVFPLWALFELVYRARTRALASCSSCGFDPYLYLVDTQKARKEMEGFWKKKLESRIVARGTNSQNSPSASAPQASKKTSTESQSPKT